MEINNTWRCQLNIPAELKYTSEHEWVRAEGNIAEIGITDYAQGELGDIVFVELPEIGVEIKAAQPVATIEAVKTTSDLFSPVSGKVIETNASLEGDPLVVNRDPYGEGWMLKIQMSEPGELDKLLSAEAYQKLIE